MSAFVAQSVMLPSLADDLMIIERHSTARVISAFSVHFERPYSSLRIEPMDFGIRVA